MKSKNGRDTLNKKQVRKAFREAVFKRAKYKCECCGKKGKDRQGGELYKKYHSDPSPANDFRLAYA